MTDAMRHKYITQEEQAEIQPAARSLLELCQRASESAVPAEWIVFERISLAINAIMHEGGEPVEALEAASKQLGMFIADRVLNETDGGQILSRAVGWVAEAYLAARKAPEVIGRPH